MKEKEVQLTIKSVNSKLEVGEQFMPEPGQSELESTIQEPTEVRSAWEKVNRGRTLSVSERRTQEMLIERGILPVAGASDTEPKEVPSEKPEYTVVKPDGTIAFYIKEGHLSPEQAKEFVSLFEGKNLTPEQQALRDKLYVALQDDPAGFAKMLTKAVESLREKDLESILKEDTDNLVDLYLNETERQVGNKFSAELMSKYRKRFTEIKSLPPHIARLELQKLVRAVASQRTKALKVDESMKVEAKDYRKMELPEIIKDIRNTVKELSREEKAKYREKLVNVLKLDKSEQKAQLILILQDMESVFKDKDKIIASQMRGLMEELADKETAARTREEMIEEMVSGFEADMEIERGRLINIVETFGASDDASNAVFDEFLYANGTLINMVAASSGGNMDEIRRARLNIESIRDATNLTAEQKKERLAEIVNSVTKRFLEYQTPKNPDQYNPVNSVQELSRYLVTSQNAEYWGVDGVFPLIDREGKFHPENLLKWGREQSVLLHLSNPNDQISPLGSIHINTGFRDVSLIEMTLINKQRYFRDEKTGEIMEDLANALLYDTWLFGVVRNSDLVYRQTMNEDKKLPEVVGQIHSRSDITRSTNLRDILKMSGEFGSGEINEGRAVMFANEFYYNLSDWEKLTEIVRGSEIQKGKAQLEADLREGRINQETFQSRLKDLPKEQSGFMFTKDDFRDAIRIIQKKKDWEDIDSFEGYFDSANSDEFYCTDPYSGIKYSLFEGDKFNVKNFAKVMNFYNYANAPQSMFELAKELVRLKAAEKYGLNPGIARTETAKSEKRKEWESIVRAQLSLGRTEEQATSAANRKLLDIERYAERVNISFAENIGEHFQRAYGGGARNDVNRRGYDASTKGNLEDYSIRQSEAVRAGPTGVREAIGIYRNIIPDMWSALKTEGKMSPMEIFNEIRGVENIPHEWLLDRYLGSGRIKQEEIKSLSNEDKSKLLEDRRKDEIKEWIEKLKFNQNAERDIAGNVKMRGFQIFHAQTGGERLDINKMVTYDAIQGALVDLGYVEENFNDGFIKPARYFGNTNGGMKFSSKVRRLDVVATNNLANDAVPVYEDVTLAEASYGPEVINLVKEKWAKEHNGEEMDFRNLTDKQKKYLDGAVQIDSGEIVSGRMDMVKFGIALNVAAELRHHRHFGGPGAKWGYVRTEAFFSLLNHMEELEPDPDHPGRTRVRLGPDGKPMRFFDEDLIKLMRNNSDSKPLKLLVEDLGVEMGGPALSSLLEILARTMQYTIKA